MHNAMHKPNQWHHQCNIKPFCGFRGLPFYNKKPLSYVEPQTGVCVYLQRAARRWQSHRYQSFIPELVYPFIQSVKGVIPLHQSDTFLTFQALGWSHLNYMQIMFWRVMISSNHISLRVILQTDLILWYLFSVRRLIRLETEDCYTSRSEEHTSELQSR